MREILFRGKRADNGEWVCSGNLIHFNEYNECYIPKTDSECTCTHDENDNIIEWKKVMFCKVIPETVGQYTGLTDKNGKKIFEGDILGAFLDDEYPNNFTTVEVIWHNNGWYIKQKNTMPDMFEYSDAQIFEVFGNIHDNPELLGGAE